MEFTDVRGRVFTVGLRFELIGCDTAGSDFGINLICGV